MATFFEKYGVRDKREYDDKVRGDATFAARVAEDYFELSHPSEAAVAEPVEHESEKADEAAE